MDGSSVLSEIQFVMTLLRVDTTRVSSEDGSFPPMGVAGKRPEFDIKLPLGAPFLRLPRGYPLMSCPHRDTAARQRGFDIRVFTHLGELLKAVEHHYPFAIYTAGNSVTTSGIRLRPSHWAPFFPLFWEAS